MQQFDSSTYKSESTTDLLAESLANYICQAKISNRLIEGDLFMTVKQISEKFEVSRTIAREAVSQLRAFNIVRSRPRKGLLIGSADPIEALSQCWRFYKESTNKHEILVLSELRYTIEIGAIDLIIKNRSQTQADELYSIAHEFDAISNLKDTDIIKVNQLDSKFHSQLLKMSGNSLIPGLHHVATCYFDISNKIGSTLLDPKSAQEHLLISEAILKRDTESARKILRSHLFTGLNSMKAFLNSQSKVN